MMAPFCFPSNGITGSPRVWALHRVGGADRLGMECASWLRSHLLRILGLSLRELLPQVSSLPSCPFNHSTPASAPAGPGCSPPPVLLSSTLAPNLQTLSPWEQTQPDTGPTTEAGEKGSPGRSEAAGSHALWRETWAAKGKEQRPAGQAMPLAPALVISPVLDYNIPDAIPRPEPSPAPTSFSVAIRMGRQEKPNSNALNLGTNSCYKCYGHTGEGPGKKII